MKNEEGREEFIQLWGTIGTNWGINRTMAQVHALLLISADAQSAEDVMEALNVSRGNVNMNLRALIDWGLVRKTHKAGERREFFIAEKDAWKMARQIIRERKRRELDPVRNSLKELSQVEGDDVDTVAFRKMMTDLSQLTSEADVALETLMNSERTWVMQTFMKFLAKKQKS